MTDDEDIPRTPGRVVQHSPLFVFEQVAGERFVFAKREGANPQAIASTDSFPDAQPMLESELAWPICTDTVNYSHADEPFYAAREFAFANLDLQREVDYDLWAAYALVCARPEDFETIPYLYFLGPKGSGKSRATELFCHKKYGVAYRGVMSPNISLAGLFHLIDLYHVTLGLDEAEAYMTDEGPSDIQLLLNAGYSQGQQAIRMSADASRLMFYEVFGPKVLNSTRRLYQTFMSRCILFLMDKNTRPIKKRWDTNTQAEAQNVRNLLLTYRLREIGNPIPPFDNDRIPDSRTEELFYALISVVPASVRPRLYDAAIEICGDEVQADMTSWEAATLDALVKLADEVRHGKIATSRVAETVNVYIPEKERLKTHTIGKVLEGLGFRRRKTLDGLSGFLYDRANLERRLRRYAVQATLPVETSGIAGIARLNETGETGETGDLPSSPP